MSLSKMENASVRIRKAHFDLWVADVELQCAKHAYQNRERWSEVAAHKRKVLEAIRRNARSTTRSAVAHAARALAWLGLACPKQLTQGRLTADHQIHNLEAAGSIPAPAPIPLIGVNGQRQKLNDAGQSLSCPALAAGGAV